MIASELAICTIALPIAPLFILKILNIEIHIDRGNWRQNTNQYFLFSE